MDSCDFMIYPQSSHDIKVPEIPLMDKGKMNWAPIQYKDDILPI